MFDKDQSPPKSEPTPIAEIVREMTDGGRDIVRFLVDATEGRFDDFEPGHRLDAVEQLLDSGGRQGLADFVREKTDDGRLIVRFLLDVIQYKIDEVKPRDRVQARRLINLIFNGETWIPIPVPPGE